MKRLLLLLFIGFIVAGYIFSGPFRTLWGIHAAVEAKNEAQLERHIDFPAVRESLKGQIEAKIQREVAQQRDNLMMYALVSQLAPQATSSMVDEFLNMESIGTLMQTAKKHHEDRVKNQAERKGEGLALDISIRESIELILAVFEFSYKDWNSFEIRCMNLFLNSRRLRLSSKEVVLIGLLSQSSFRILSNRVTRSILLKLTK